MSGGYLLSVEPGELDADVFAERARDGRRALQERDAARASELLARSVRAVARATVGGGRVRGFRPGGHPPP